MAGPQVKEGGLIFFRESCFRQSGDAKRGANPTHYRNPRDYFAIFDGTEVAGQPPLLRITSFICVGGLQLAANSHLSGATVCLCCSAGITGNDLISCRGLRPEEKAW